ncbi:exo-alpha-sialidase [Duganella sp. FT135W]|uniref:Exo-alpha-sialidase n=1 Tax=Duganella flavida TaxID=2692175 RepID=A0A6L8K6M8_9BURK|nr:sialidase family protein [Duganella flavida]MYM22605.1 exo-alpha-sialidase [Duganella flavida]
MSEFKMRARYTKVGAVLTLLLLTHNASSDEHAHNAPGTAVPAARPAKQQLGSSTAFDPSGVLWTVSRDGDTGADHLVLEHSADSGETWSAKVSINAESVVASGDERPRINFGAKGEIYITYSRPLSKAYTSEVRFMRSENGGHSFSEPVTVHKDMNVITHGFASTVVDAKGYIYVTWIDKRDQQEAKEAGHPYAGAAQYYAVSLDGGRSFQGDYKIADHSCECCRSSLALNSEGHAVLLWRHVFQPNIRDHAFTMLTPGGKPQTIERATFDNWAIDACPHQGPALAYGDDGRRHQTWFTGGEDGGGLYYASQAATGGLVTPIRLGSGQAANAEVAVSGQQVEIAWKEFDGTVTQIRGMSSGDAGHTWQTRTLASTNGASDQPRLAKNGRRIFLVWRTETDGMRTISLPGAKP